MNRNVTKKEEEEGRYSFLHSWYVLFVVAGFLCMLFCVGTVWFVSGQSMQPTFDDGDIIYATTVREDTDLKTGDIVMFQHEDQLMMKRIHGSPGETIGDTEEDAALGIPLTTLGENEYFCVGDNYDHSKDSRMIGPIPKANIRFRYAGIRLRIWEVLPLLIFLSIATRLILPLYYVSHRYRFADEGQADMQETAQDEKDSCGESRTT